MRREITQIRDRVADEAHRLGLPVTVMFVPTRPPGRTERWASSPTPRAAVAFLTTIDPGEAARRIVADWCDAQTAAGYRVTDTDRDALERAAGIPTAVQP